MKRTKKITSSIIFSSSLILFSEVLDRDRSVLISVSSGNTTARSMSALSFAFLMSSSKFSFSWLKLRLWCDCDAGTGPDICWWALPTVVGDKLCFCRWWCWWWWWCADVGVLPNDPPECVLANDWEACICRLYSLNVVLNCSFSARSVFKSDCKAS